MLFYLDIVLTFCGWWHSVPMPYCMKNLNYVRNFFDTYIKISYIIIFVNSISGFGYKTKVLVLQITFFFVIINKFSEFWLDMLGRGRKLPDPLFDFKKDDMCNQFTNTFLELVRECIPTKTFTVRSNDQPWLTSEIRE
jgi:hypothetical protein